MLISPCNSALLICPRIMPCEAVDGKEIFETGKRGYTESRVQNRNVLRYDTMMLERDKEDIGRLTRAGKPR